MCYLWSYIIFDIIKTNVKYWVLFGFADRKITSGIYDLLSRMTFLVVDCWSSLTSVDTLGPINIKTCSTLHLINGTRLQQIRESMMIINRGVVLLFTLLASARADSVRNKDRIHFATLSAHILLLHLIFRSFVISPGVEQSMQKKPILLLTL